MSDMPPSIPISLPSAIAAALNLTMTLLNSSRKLDRLPSTSISRAGRKYGKGRESHYKNWSESMISF